MEGWVTPLDRCFPPGPEKSVISHLAAGGMIRYMLGGMDFDGPGLDIDGRPRALFAPLGEPYDRFIFAFPNTWPVAVLMPASSRPTAVESSSWARIKASFAE
jgi:hypothetical protein